MRSLQCGQGPIFLFYQICKLLEGIHISVVKFIHHLKRSKDGREKKHYARNKKIIPNGTKEKKKKASLSLKDANINMRPKYKAGVSYYW